jgi:hypothetical protein
MEPSSRRKEFFMNFSRKTYFLLAACVQAQSASAQSPVAIVEDVKGQIVGLEVMDYLVSGRTFRLAQDETVVIGYLKSCVRETIHGGTVEIGDEQSTVEAGVVERGRIECDAQDMITTSGQPLDSTGYILRDGAGSSERLPEVPRAPGPQFILYGSSPLIELNGRGPLVIARLDTKGEYFNFEIDPDRLQRGLFLDLAVEGKSLSPGGVYGARWQKRLVVFKVDSAARPGATPMLGRLLRLGFTP